MLSSGPLKVLWCTVRAQVYANDLNPDSFHYLQKNTQLNKVGGCHASHSMSVAICA